MIPKNEILALSKIKGVGPSQINQICRIGKNVNSIFELHPDDLLGLA